MFRRPFFRPAVLLLAALLALAQLHAADLPPPVITGQPQATTVATTYPAAFTVVATGSALSYQWLKNGTPIGGVTGAALTLGAVQMDDAAQYSVVVSNSGGAVTSAAVTLNVEPAHVFRTLAGRSGRGSQDGVGREARLNSPWHVAVDAGGNLYVSDTGNFTIRKITAAGVVTTLAGFPGQRGSADGVGSAARFRSPSGIAVDAAGFVFVGDFYDDTIRKISPEGVVTTLAGVAGQQGSTDGTGSAARFSGIRGLALDGAGTLYVADSLNAVVRKVSPTGVVTTLAGSPGQWGSTDGVGSAARLGWVPDLTVDGEGDVWVLSDDTIRKITPGGLVSTFATQLGFSGAGLDFDGPVSIDRDADGNLYVGVADMIRKITPAGVVSLIAGRPGVPGNTDGTADVALLGGSGGLAVDGTDNFYFTDSNSVRKITPTGVVSTLAGFSGIGSADGSGAAARFCNPNRAAVDGAGNFYVADRSNQTIRKITPAGEVSTLAGSPGEWGTQDGKGSAARFADPNSLAVDGAGNVFVADYSNQAIRKITPSGVVSTLSVVDVTMDGAGIRVVLFPLVGVLVDSTGNLVVATATKLWHVTPAGWAKTFAGAEASGSVDGVGAQARFAGLTAIAIDQAGNVFATDSQSIRKIAPTGVVSTVPGSEGIAGMNLVVDGAGNLLVADDSSLRKITPAGVVVTVAGVSDQPGSGDGPGWAARFYFGSFPSGGLAIDSLGRLLAVDTANQTIRLGWSTAIVPPTIVTPPASQTGTGDGSVTLSVSTGGSPGVYQWYHDGVLISGATNATLTLSHLASVDSGSYTVAVTNAAGTVTSPAAVLTVPVPPVITQQPVGVVLAETYAASFAVKASGHGVSYQWRRNGQPIVGATKAAFAIDQATLADAGDYTAVVSNEFGSVTSAVAGLQVEPAYTFTTIAGRSGIGSSDGTGGAARFNLPQGLGVDHAGNLYVADMFNWTIRKVSPEGVVTTFAGSTGHMGEADGLGSAARFSGPGAVAVDATGRVYVVDNDVVRKISPAGQVSTLAGVRGQSGYDDGPADSATFGSLSAIVADTAGNVYVADSYNRTIRKITPAGVVSTFAGSRGSSGYSDESGTKAIFGLLRGMTIDAAGNLFVTDDEAVRKITPAGVVSTYAGQRGMDGNTDGAGPVAMFRQPAALAADAAGNLYVADNGNHTVRRVAPDRTVTTLAGRAGATGLVDGIGAAASFAAITAIVVDGAGNIFVTDDNTVRRITPAGQVSTLAGHYGQGSADASDGAAAQFRFPSAVAADRAGNLYVADTNNHTVRKISPTGAVSTLAGAAGQPGSADGTGANARFYEPQGVAVDASGNVYVSDTSNQTIRKVTPAGEVSTLAGTAGAFGRSDGSGAAARFGAPIGIAVDAAGYLYVADDGFNAVRKITPEGVVTTLAGNLQSSGYLDGAGSQARFDKPLSLTLDAAGNIYVVEKYGFRIRKITPLGLVSTVAGNGQWGAEDGTLEAAQFAAPAGVAVDAAGNVFVADSGSLCIREITPTGLVVTIGGGPYQLGSADGTGSAARFFFSTFREVGLAIDRLGRLYVVDPANHTIRRGVSTAAITPAIVTPPVSQTGSFGGAVTLSVTAGGTGPFIYQWNHDGVAIEGATDATLAFDSFSAAEVGAYTVVVTNAVGTVTSVSATLSAPGPLSIVAEPVDCTAVAGQPATLSVTATGTGALTYQWRRNGFPIAGATSASYTIASASRTDADYYDVIVADGMSVTTSTAARLDVAPSAYPEHLAIDPAWNVALEAPGGTVSKVLPLAEGKFLVAGDFSRINGHATGNVARFNADGTIDRTFSSPISNGYAETLALQDDDHILVGGSFTVSNGILISKNLVRLKRDGSLDWTFNLDGIGPNAGSESVKALAVGRDGKIYVAGYFSRYNDSDRNALARLNSDGTLDQGYAPKPNGFVLALATEDDGALWVGGAFTTISGVERGRIARIKADGSLDAAFIPGPGADRAVYALAAVGDGKVYAGGEFTTFNGSSAASYLRLNANGSVDSTFDTSGFSGSAVRSLSRELDGKILIGGSFYRIRGNTVRSLARVTADGTFAWGQSTDLNDTLLSAGTLSSGKIAVVGYFKNFIVDNQFIKREGFALLTAAGQLDLTFDSALRQQGTVNALALVPGGKLAIAGDFTTVNGTERNGVAQLNRDGTLDSAFDPGAGANFGATRIVRQADGKLVVAGNFTRFDGLVRPGLVRLLPGGAVDPAFAPVGASPDSAFYTLGLTVTAGGQVVIGGSFFGSSIGPASGLDSFARFKPDGSLDSTCSLVSGSSVECVAAQADGSLWLGGYFSAINGVASHGIARVNGDGSLDTHFDSGSGVNGFVVASASLPGGGAWIAGTFGSYAGIPRAGLARIRGTGALDTGFASVPFNGGGVYRPVAQILPQNDGRVIIAGGLNAFKGVSFTQYLARINADGTVDDSFGLVGVPRAIAALAQADDGSLYLAAGDSLVHTVAAAKPTITTPPLSQTVAADGKVTFTAAFSNVGPVTYQWLRDGVAITGAVQATLTLSGVTTADVGAYTVAITSASGAGTTISAAAVLTVDGPPTIISHPAWQKVFAGNTATFAVKAKAAVSYQWQRSTDGGENWTPLTEGAPYSGVATATLVVSGVTPETSGGLFRVVATNDFGSITTEAMPLTVAPVPSTVGTAWLAGDAGSRLPRYRLRVVAAGVIDMAAGWSHSVLLKSDGTVWSTGDNSYGALGDQTTDSRSLFRQVATGVAKIAAGGAHTLMIKDDGTLWAVGANYSAQLGDGTPWYSQKFIPVQVMGGIGVVAAAGGNAFTLFLKSDGTLWGVGDNHYGQLATGSTDECDAPVQIASGVASVAGGSSTGACYFVKQDGSLWGVGSNSAGQLGDGSTVDRMAPVQIATGVASMTANYEHLLFVKSDGTLWAVGGNSSGQLGDGTRTNRTTPVQIATAVASVAAGADFSLFVKTDGTLWGTGNNALGALGDESSAADHLVPVQVDTDVVKAMAGGGHSLILKRDGTLWTVGYDESGQLGDGQVRGIVPLATEVTSAVAGWQNTLLATKADGTLWRRQPGDPLRKIDGIDGVVDVALGAAGSRALYLKADSTLWLLADDNTATRVDTDVISVRAGSYFFAYLKTDGSLWGQGDNSSIKFGDGVSPARVADRVSAVAAAGWHILFVKSDHTLWGMGNPWGGFADTVPPGGWISTPVQLETDVSFADATSGQNIYLKTDGSLWTRGMGWAGWNGPAVQVDTAVVAAASGYSVTYYLKADGVLRSRLGAQGTLGDVVEVAGGVAAMRNVEDAGAVTYLQTAGYGTSLIFAQLPHAATAALGSTLTLTATAAGSGPIGYQWFKDGVAISWAHASQLTIPYVTAADIGSYTVTVTNSAGSVTSAAAKVTVPSLEPAPVIGTPPAGKAAVVGTGVSFTVSATGTGPLRYQWRKGGVNLDDGSRITGATTATLSIAGLTVADAGDYSVVVSDAGGSTTSSAAALVVVDVHATHGVVGGGYVAGGAVTIANVLSYTGGLSGLGWSVLLPDGWNYASGTASAADTKPKVGDTGLLEWTWTTMPASPVTFGYTLNVPVGTTGAHPIAAQILVHPSGAEVQLLAQPDPLSVYEARYHSADTNRDGTLNLSELLRVIELYNTRQGSTRTGRYLVQVGAEDGFAADALTADGATVTLTAYHSADTTRDGRLNLTELLRVIELYNYRSGTSRTGQYHPLRAGEPLTEDGFVPGT